MKNAPTTCPNEACVNHTNPPAKWFEGNGTFKFKLTQKKIPRYRCKVCGKGFSTHTDSPMAYMKKPDIQLRLFGEMVSGVSMRRASQLLHVQEKTVLKHIKYLVAQIKEIHKAYLSTLKTSYVLVDELETFMVARPCPLSVPMVVHVRTGKILGFEVARMPAKGHLAQIGQSRYGWTVDNRQQYFKKMISDLLPCFKQKITFKCDNHPHYDAWIRSQIPPIFQVDVDQTPAKKKKTPIGQPKPFDELFKINNTFAKMRNDMNRLARKTWNTTKKEYGLENHIWLYIAWHNKYFQDPTAKKKALKPVKKLKPTIGGMITLNDRAPALSS